MELKIMQLLKLI